MLVLLVAFDVRLCALLVKLQSVAYRQHHPCCRWTGGASGVWETPQNWNSTTYPGQTQGEIATVIIDTDGAVRQKKRMRCAQNDVAQVVRYNGATIQQIAAIYINATAGATLYLTSSTFYSGYVRVNSHSTLNIGCERIASVLH